MPRRFFISINNLLAASLTVTRIYPSIESPFLPWKGDFSFAQANPSFCAPKFMNLCFKKHIKHDLVFCIASASVSSLRKVSSEFHSRTTQFYSSVELKVSFFIPSLKPKNKNQKQTHSKWKKKILSRKAVTWRGYRCLGN